MHIIYVHMWKGARWRSVHSVSVFFTQTKPITDMFALHVSRKTSCISKIRYTYCSNYTYIVAQQSTCSVVHTQTPVHKC